MKKVSVQCRNIRLSYGTTEVLRDVSLDIQPGEFFALLGPSGSGKSSLLRLIAGFNRHTHGQLLVDGQDITALETWQRPVGLVFQNYALWPHLSVWDNVAFGLVEGGLAKEPVPYTQLTLPTNKRDESRIGVVYLNNKLTKLITA